MNNTALSARSGPLDHNGRLRYHHLYLRLLEPVKRVLRETSSLNDRPVMFRQGC